MTWNVGNKQPLKEELAHWLPEHGGMYDLIVIGTQENAFRKKKKGSSRHQTLATTDMSRERDSRSDREDEDHESDEEDVYVLSPGASPFSREDASTTTAFPSTLDGTPSGSGSGSDRKRSWQQRAGAPDASGMSWKARLHESSQAFAATTDGGDTLTKHAVAVLPKCFRPKPHAWDAMCAQRLGAGFVALAQVSLRGMRLGVYCHKDLATSSAHHVGIARAATGVAGVVGNKGGLVVRLTLGHTSFAFCSCHLAAHESEAHQQARNAMARKVLLKTMGGKVGSGRPLDAVHAADHVLWLGDLNYRVDLGLDSAREGPLPEGHAAHFAEVLALIEAEQWDALMRADQLRHARAHGDAFVGFSEGAYHFKPTFKLLREAGVAYHMKRTPSYCDRILWKSMPPLHGRLVQSSLFSVPQVSSSDHKPVVSTLEVTPSPRLTRTPAPQATIRISGLCLCDILAADMTGTSDPFCVFYTHPQGLLRKSGLKTTVKWGVQPGDEAGRTGEAAAFQAAHLGGVTSCLHGCTSAFDWLRGAASGPVAIWKDSHIPELSLHVPIDQLQDVCLLIAIFDYNTWKRNDALGVVTIPLRPFEKSRTNHKGGYVLPIRDAPIVLGHSTAGTGRLSCELHVSRFSEGTGLISRLLAGMQLRRHNRARSLEQEGDYTAAAQELASVGAREIAEEDLADDEIVRSRVRDLVRLAEMKWRYRVVAKGESPHDKAIEHLERAKSLIEAHQMCVLAEAAPLPPSGPPSAPAAAAPTDATPATAGSTDNSTATPAVDPVSAAMAAISTLPAPAPPRSSETSSGSSPSRPTSRDLSLRRLRRTAAAAAFRQRWASELSAVLHGLCATHLIFGTGDPAVVEAQLHECLALREECGLVQELADSLNSLGRLKQQQRAFADAERHYRRSLQLRRNLQPDHTDTGAEKAAHELEQAQAKQQAIAQSLVSLGNLSIERGDAAAVEAEERAGGALEYGGGDLSPSSSLPAKAHYAEARGHLEAAAAAYVKGSPAGEMHPKVAWAHEGLGRLAEKEGDVPAALSGYERAAQILRALHAHDEGKEMFRKELDAVEKKREALLQATGAAASRPDAIASASELDPAILATASASVAKLGSSLSSSLSGLGASLSGLITGQPHNQGVVAVVAAPTSPPRSSSTLSSLDTP